MVISKIKEEAKKHLDIGKQHIQSNFIKKFFIIGIFLGLLLGYYLNSGSSTENNNINEYKVSSGDITNSIKAYGSAEIVDEQQLRFNQQGEVSAVYFKKGDEVKKGDIIAELDQDSVLNEILQAEINLANAKLQLEETLKGNTQAQILQAQNSLEQSKLQLEIGKKELKTLTEQKDNFLIDQSKSLSGAELDNETILENTKISIRGFITDGENILKELNNIFGATKKYSSQVGTYENYLSVKDPSIKFKTVSNILSGYDQLDELKTYYYNQIDSSGLYNISIITNGLNLTQNLYGELFNATNNGYNALINSITDNNFFTENTLDGYKTSVYNDISKIKTSINSLLSAKNQVNSLNGPEYQKREYEKNLKDYEIKIQTQEKVLKNLENTIIIQEETVKDLKEGNTQQQIQIARNNVKQKELALNNTKENLDNLRIEAPFDGKIRKIDFKKGDKITSDEQKYVYLENPDLVEVSILIDQIDVVNISAGMKVEVQLDAYPSETFEGVLGDIDSTPVTSEGVVSYTVKVSIDKGDKIIYGGMTATVKIIIEDKQNVILIPTSYIQSKGDQKYVLDKNNNEKYIVVGANDDSMTEIVSGLSENDIIIKAQTNSSSSSNKTNSFGMPMGGGMGSMGGGMRPN